MKKTTTLSIFSETSDSYQSLQRNKVRDEENQTGWKTCNVISRNCFLGPLYMALLIITRLVVMLSSQAVGSSINIFELFSIKYTVTAAFSCIINLLKRGSFTIKKHHIGYIFLCGFTQIFSTYGTFYAVSYMPVGNTDAVTRVLSTIWAMLFDSLKGNIFVHDILISVVTIVGILFVIQPWSSNGEHISSHKIPCQYWERVLHVDANNDTLPNFTSVSHPWNTTNQTPFSTSQFNSNATMTESNPITLKISGTEYHLATNSVYFCYFLLLNATLSATIRLFIIKHLTKDMDPCALSTWISLGRSLIVTSVNVVWSIISGKPLYSLPLGTVCRIFMCSYLTSSALNNLITFHVVEYFTVTKTSVSLLLGSMILYIFQRTLLKTFHPGHANFQEILGITLALGGVLCSSLTKTKEKSAEKSNT